MKKTIRFLAAFIIVFGILGAVICLFIPEFYYQHVYMGSRIKGNVTFSVDGVEVPINECGLSCMHSMIEPQDISINGSRLKVKADDYGLYSFTAVSGGTELRFYIDKRSEWECVSFDMDFDIDTAERVIQYTGKYRNFSDGLLKAEDVPVYGDYSLDYEHHSVGVYVNIIK